MNQKVQVIIISVITTLLIAVPLSVFLAYLFIDMKYENLMSLPEEKTIQETLQEFSNNENNNGQAMQEPEDSQDSVEEEVASRASEETLMPNQQTAATEIGRLTLERHVFTTNEATYEIAEEWVQRGDGGVRQPVYRTAHGKSERTVWVADLRSLSPEPLNPFQGFWIFANPAHGHMVYLRLLQFETEAPVGKIYALNIQDKTMTLVQSSLPNANHFNAAVSPDGMRYVSFDETSQGHDQSLYLIDLVEDSARRIVQLTGNESLNAGGEALSVDADISWFDNDTLRYAVYDQSLKTPGGSNDEAFIEYRTVNVGQK